ncbi:MAG TPA: response regulator transcription factor [Actinomycetota bacterium]|nr:response regulator transcription factor [Actinomycetota bacterium]
MIKVLVVDDNETLREALAEALGDRGMVVVGQADDGEEACERALELEPDVVVMDIRMPGMSGPDATIWLAANCPGIRVVGLTAYEDVALHDAMETAGAAKVLVKGASIKQIVNAIGEAGSVRG